MLVDAHRRRERHAQNLILVVDAPQAEGLRRQHRVGRILQVLVAIPATPRKPPPSAQRPSARRRENPTAGSSTDRRVGVAAGDGTDTAAHRIARGEALRPSSTRGRSARSAGFW